MRLRKWFYISWGRKARNCRHNNATFFILFVTFYTNFQSFSPQNNLFSQTRRIKPLNKNYAKCKHTNFLGEKMIFKKWGGKWYTLTMYSSLRFIIWWNPLKKCSCRIVNVRTNLTLTWLTCSWFAAAAAAGALSAGPPFWIKTSFELVQTGFNW